MGPQSAKKKKKTLNPAITAWCSVICFSRTSGCTCAYFKPRPGTISRIIFSLFLFPRPIFSRCVVTLMSVLGLDDSFRHVNGYVLCTSFCAPRKRAQAAPDGYFACGVLHEVVVCIDKTATRMMNGKPNMTGTGLSRTWIVKCYILDHLLERCRQRVRDLHCLYFPCMRVVFITSCIVGAANVRPPWPPWLSTTTFPFKWHCHLVCYTPIGYCRKMSAVGCLLLCSARRQQMASCLVVRVDRGPLSTQIQIYQVCAE